MCVTIHGPEGCEQYPLWGKSMSSVEEDIRKEQREHLRRMNTKEKAAYIWGYYKWHMIGVLFAIILITSLIHDMLQNSRPVFVDILLLNTDAGFDAGERLVSDIASFSGVDTREYRINVDSSLYINEDDSVPPGPVAAASAQKLLALYAAGEVDVMIAPEAVIESYLRAGIYTDPETVLEKSYIKELENKGYELYFRKLSEMTDPEDMDEAFKDRDVCVGIVINNSSYLSEAGVYDGLSPDSETDVIFTFSSVGQHLDNARSFLDLITR